MPNPIIGLMESLSPTSRAVGQATRTAQSMQTGGLLGALMQNDPRMAQVIEYINQNGGDPKQAFYNMAKERNADPNDILSQIRRQM